jgi:hypothetical protein
VTGGISGKTGKNELKLFLRDERMEKSKRDDGKSSNDEAGNGFGGTEELTAVGSGAERKSFIALKSGWEWKGPAIS